MRAEYETLRAVSPQHSTASLWETPKSFLPIPSYGFVVSEMTGKVLNTTELSHRSQQNGLCSQYKEKQGLVCSCGFPLIGITFCSQA